MGSGQGLDLEYQEEVGLDGSHCRPRRSSTNEKQERLVNAVMRNQGKPDVLTYNQQLKLCEHPAKELGL